MANQSADQVKDVEDDITRGTGNVFADLGYPDADERQTKLRLRTPSTPPSRAGG